MPDETGKDPGQQEQEMREHEREAQEREAAERPPAQRGAEGGEAAPPGNAQRGSLSS